MYYIFSQVLLPLFPLLSFCIFFWNILSCFRHSKAFFPDAQLGGVVSSLSLCPQPASWSFECGGAQGRRVSKVWSPLQAQELTTQPPEVGVREGATVPVPLLQLPSEAEDACSSAHWAYASRKTWHLGIYAWSVNQGRVSCSFSAGHCISSFITVIETTVLDCFARISFEWIYKHPIYFLYQKQKIFSIFDLPQQISKDYFHVHRVNW